MTHEDHEDDRGGDDRRPSGDGQPCQCGHLERPVLPDPVVGSTADLRECRQLSSVRRIVELDRFSSPVGWCSGVRQGIRARLGALAEYAATNLGKRSGFMQPKQGW